MQVELLPITRQPEKDQINGKENAERIQKVVDQGRDVQLPAGMFPIARTISQNRPGWPLRISGICGFNHQWYPDSTTLVPVGDFVGNSVISVPSRTDTGTGHSVTHGTDLGNFGIYVNPSRYPLTRSVNGVTINQGSQTHIHDMQIVGCDWAIWTEYRDRFVDFMYERIYIERGKNGIRHDAYGELDRNSHTGTIFRAVESDFLEGTHMYVSSGNSAVLIQGCTDHVNRVGYHFDAFTRAIMEGVYSEAITNKKVNLLLEPMHKGKDSKVHVTLRGCTMQCAVFLGSKYNSVIDDDGTSRNYRRYTSLHEAYD